MDLKRAYRFGVRMNRSRQIWNGWSRLNPVKYRSGPFDLDPKADDRAYPFALWF
jgi:hypothetical protein